MRTIGWCGLIAGLLLCPYVLGAAAAKLPKEEKQRLAACYVKKDTWQESMMAARETLAKVEAEEATELELSPQQAGTSGEKWTPWYHIGTFQNPGKSSFSEVFPPETEIELSKTYGQLRWTLHPEWEDGVVHDLHTGDNTATYLYRTVTVKAPKTLTGYFGSDDGMVFWLNGKKLISNDVPRGAAPNQDQAKLELAAGENKLLFKIHNQSGGCGFYFSTNPQPGGAHSQGVQLRDGFWELVRRDFTQPEARRQMDWERQDGLWVQDWPAGDLSAFADRYAKATRGLLSTEAKAAAKDVRDPAGLARLRTIYHKSRMNEEALAQVRTLSVAPLRRAIEDLSQTYSEKYPKAAEYLRRCDDVEKALASLPKALATAADEEACMKAAEQFKALRLDALLSNPLLDFDRLLLVKRDPKQLGLPQNWQGNCALPRNGYDNEIAVLSPVGPQGKLTTLYKPEKGEFVGDVDLHFDADRMLLSMPGSHGRWQIWELKSDGTGLRQVTAGEEPDVDNYDPCYLPSGKIIYGSTMAFHGVPCVGGGNTVANLCVMDADGRNVRQLTFDQDHNWCPTVLNDGRVLYTRWEYSDTSHYFTRHLFHMNPDGTGQMEYYHSNSYWPNSTFYARPIPGHPTEVVAVISGHHGVPRMGELVLLDPARGRHEADGAVQRIPGYGKPVPPTIADGLVEGSWPKFLHPYPLSDRYFLVSAKLTAQAEWSLYLVDIFDNMLPLLEVPGYALLEPLPFRKTATPPVIPDKVKPDCREATIYISDIYRGEAMHGVPRGTVKKLRLYEPHYAYPQMGGHINIGIDGPWDVHRIIGTVPVYEDGSANFKVPANTPLAVQPLDAEGRAVQLMRSWFTAEPGEVLSCVGCHDRQNSTPPSKPTYAAARAPADITPWYGPARGFSFKREVQPALDKFCVGCHVGQASGLPNNETQAGKPVPQNIPDFTAKDKNGWRNFTQSYIALHPFVRRPGPESDYHVLVPMEYHAGTSELIQMLKKGHYNVKPDEEAWDRLYTWIDLNVPDHGTWHEHRAIAGNQHDRRLEMRTKYANRPEDPEAIPEIKAEPVKYVQPEPFVKPAAQKIECPGWPFDAAEAKKRQDAAGLPTALKLELGTGAALDLVLIPAGEFVMGDLEGEVDEYPLARVKIAAPFYMAKTETTNAQYKVFDPQHDSSYISVFNKDQGDRGLAANGPAQPVIRVSWTQAQAYCAWLSEKTGRKCALPTEAQWEYACRAGTATPLSYGDCSTDFGKQANLADSRLLSLCRGDSPKWIPAVAGVNDGAAVTENVGKYQPNAWGLNDMHGNVAEWTRTEYRPYPYREDDGRNEKADTMMAVRGGSFYDRPQRARSAFRLSYPAWQRIFNVGFRVTCEAAPATQAK
ncbi:MAG: SUMF1/EgtB/PvdO family nonheme iron enzyme [Planctomycetota bacterium]